MSKINNSKVKRLNNEKHSTPEDLHIFKECFKIIPGVERVGVGRFKPANKNLANLEIVGYDDLKSSFEVKITYAGFLQYFYLEVQEDNKCMVQNKLENYLNIE